ncbi:MAG TPA: TIR domain-containing protein [Sphingomicrobium sp.]|nr:TIR domain-containing protein [Sphingomicrobium sp.]
MSGPDIFISYCRQDRASARLFAEAFVEEGFNVWWDAVMHSGETFDEVIERNLRASKAVVVLWSPRSVASRWVRAEATQADRANKLVPVIIEPCERPIIFELTHTADLPEWQGDRSDVSWQSLVNDLRRLVGPAKEELPAQKGAQAATAPPQAPPVAESTEKPGRAAEAVDPAKEAEQAKIAREAQAASDDELAKALDRLALKRGSTLHEPTPVELAQANFFRQADEFRQSEGDTVHCLRRIHALDPDTYHVIGPAGLKIGRTRPADIIVAEPSVSREHCVVELAADKLRVLDLNSTNGTYIDNKRIGRAEILPVGSTLRVGNVSFEHEVRSRADVEQQGDALGFDSGQVPRDTRIARSS